jgi:hypothetical protein
MTAVREVELQHDPDLPQDELDRLHHPSAYFDYIVGTSTGGYVVEKKLSSQS